jgi:hypothetical protein
MVWRGWEVWALTLLLQILFDRGGLLWGGFAIGDADAEGPRSGIGGDDGEGGKLAGLVGRCSCRRGSESGGFVEVPTVANRIDEDVSLRMHAWRLLAGRHDEETD